MSKKLLAIGAVYLDINSSGVPFGESGMVAEKELVSNSYDVEPGGSAVNFARLCVSLGLKTVCIGKIGDDRPGRLLTDLMHVSGVEASFIKSPTVATNLGLNFVNPAGRSIMVAVGSANQSLESREVVEHAKPLLGGLEYLYIGGCFKLTTLLPAFEELVGLAKANGTKIILDHARLTQKTTKRDIDFVKRLALQADFYFPARREFQEIWEVDSIEKGLQQLQDKTAACIVVKDGQAGAVALPGREILRVPAFRVPLFHTVGAGDSFNAGFMAAQEQGLDLKQSMRFGCATAALKISHAELPTQAAVEALMAGK